MKHFPIILLLIFIASTSLAQDWERTDSPDKLYKLTTHPNGNIIAYDTAHLWHSDSDGFNWHLDTTLCCGNVEFVVDSNHNIIMIQKGIVYSSDNVGGTWKFAFKNRLRSDFVYSILPLKDLILAATGSGLYMSTNNGSVWTYLWPPIDPVVPLTSLTWGHDGYIYALDLISGNLIYRSADTGKTFQNCFIKEDGSAVGGEDVIIANIYGDLFGFPNGSSSRKMYRSLDHGDTWSLFTQGLTCSHVYSMIELPDGGIAAGTDNGVFILPLEGCEWVPFSSGLVPQNILSLACNKRGQLYAACGADGIFKNQKMFNDSSNFTGLLDPASVDYQTVVIGSTSCSDLMLKNKGNKPLTIKSYTIVDPIPFSLNKTTANSFPVTIEPNSYLMIPICFSPPQIGVYSSSIIWNTDIDSSLCTGITTETKLQGIAEANSDVPITPTPLQKGEGITVSPNPIREKGEINFTLTENKHLHIECFDLLGRSVKLIADENFGAGQHSLSMDFSSQPIGLYTIIYTDGNERISQSVIVSH